MRDVADIPQNEKRQEGIMREVIGRPLVLDMRQVYSAMQSSIKMTLTSWTTSNVTFSNWSTLVAPRDQVAEYTISDIVLRL